MSKHDTRRQRPGSSSRWRVESVWAGDDDIAVLLGFDVAIEKGASRLAWTPTVLASPPCSVTVRGVLPEQGRLEI
jgi:hypothetical protein